MKEMVMSSNDSFSANKSPLDVSKDSMPPFLLQLSKNEKLASRKQSLRNVIKECQAVETERDAEEMSVQLIEIIIQHLATIQVQITDEFKSFKRDVKVPIEEYIERVKKPKVLKKKLVDILSMFKSVQKLILDLQISLTNNPICLDDINLK